MINVVDEIAVREGRSIYMEDIYVSPDHRGKGIGKSMWKACVKVGIFYNNYRRIFLYFAVVFTFMTEWF
jgi:ribosomal protein S18 acetylase RimI-like enzyme